jgi:hypothetical protein
MKLIYLAAPFRAKNSWEVEQNIRRVEEWAMIIAQHEQVPIIPHSMYRYFNGTMTDEFWLDATLTLLKNCDAAIFIEGWKNSKGSCGEDKLAYKLNMPTVSFCIGDTKETFLNRVVNLLKCLH